MFKWMQVVFTEDYAQLCCRSRHGTQGADVSVLLRHEAAGPCRVLTAVRAGGLLSSAPAKYFSSLSPLDC